MKPRWIMLAVCLGMTGCFTSRTRLQSADENEARESEVRTIGDITTPAMQEEIPLVGVGLVIGLNGTGAPPPAGSWREALEKDLKSKGFRDLKRLLDSTNSAMVIVSAQVPAGTRKNDPVDIKLEQPPGSRCTSLKGGYLASCELFNFESAKKLNPKFQGADQLLKGFAVVRAEGPVIVGLNGRVHVADKSDGDSETDSRNEDESLRTGRVWSGGKCLLDPPMMLVLNQASQQSRIASQVADRINQSFPGTKYGGDGIATAKNKSLVMIGVPLQYRHDISHYLRVLRAIPLDRSPPLNGAYRRQLQEQLLDPVKCLSAAIRLEALGEESVPALRSALAAPLPMSRFAAARALTYLRKRDGVDELARLARYQPVMRAMCLTALASLDESICHVRLADLMSDADPEVRYGAFCGLRRLDDRAPEVAFEKCKDAYFVHTVAPDSAPMVHYLTGRRTEFVLFGRSPTILPDLQSSFGDLLGGFSISTRPDGTCSLKRYSLKSGGTGVVAKECSLQVADVLKTLAEMGGSYTDAVDLLVKASANGKLSCDLCHDALPRSIEPSQLARMAKDDPTLRNSH